MVRLQPMDLTSLRAVLAELRPLLVPSRFEKAQQSSPSSLQIGLRHLQGLQWLEISWQPEAARVHAIPSPPRQGEGSTLAQQLQHGLRGLALTRITQPPWERVVDLGFSRRPQEPDERRLVVELMGRHSNLFLLDGDGRVIALARQVKPEQSRLRPIGTGDLYRAPPPLTGTPPSLEEPFERWQQRLKLLPLTLDRALQDAYQGISPALIRQLLPAGSARQSVLEATPGQWLEIWKRWRSWLETLQEEHFHWEDLGEGYCCWQPTPNAAPAQGPMVINQAMARYYGAHLTARTFQEQRRRLGERVERLVSREATMALEQEQLLATAPDSDHLQAQADALLSQQEPTRQCIDTAQKLYRRARKLRRSVAAITPRLAQHRERHAALEASIVYLEQAENLEQLQSLEQEINDLSGQRPAQGAKGRRRDKTQPGPPRPLVLNTPRGLAVQIGRNHHQNEWIALRQARRGDLWFHAQELPGSHVVLKSSQAHAEDADLQWAADLAAHFSRGRANGKVPVLMVPVEELQRIPGAAAGTVRHRGGQVLWGVPERALVLLAKISA